MHHKLSNIFGYCSFRRNVLD